MTSLGDREQRAVAAISGELAAEFMGVFSIATSSGSLPRPTGTSPRPRGSPPTCPCSPQRFSRERLRALAQVGGGILTDIPEVLFVCEHNAGRSQMAAALLDHHAQNRVHVRSAGSQPAERVNPAVVDALAEMSLDVTKAFPKPLTDEAASAADVVITMGAATPARFTPAGAISTGSCLNRRARHSKRSAPFATRSTVKHVGCSDSSPPPADVNRTIPGSLPRQGFSDPKRIWVISYMNCSRGTVAQLDPRADPV